MQYVGFILGFLALVALVFGLLQHLKGKKVLAAPFKRTGEIAQNASNPAAVADAKGIVSCEGAIQALSPTIAPCSGQPCVYFEIEVIQEWERSAISEDGVKTERGKDTIQTVKTGGPFGVDDGSGAVTVSPAEGMDVELDKSFEQSQNVGFGDVFFGQFQTHVPMAGGDKSGRSVKVVEKIVPPMGSIFVMGQLQNGLIGKPQGMLGTLRASRKGRAALLGATKRNSIIGFALGGVFLLPGVGLSIFADPPEPTKAGEGSCNILDQSKDGDPCSGKIRSDDGTDVPLKVSQGGTFVIEGGPPRGKKIPVIASLSVKDATGKSYATNERERVEVKLPPGDFTITIKDSVPGDAARFKGGFSFELSVKRTALDPVAVDAGPEASAPVATATASASAAPTATTKKGKGTKKKK
jgi:hypothetical protein